MVELHASDSNINKAVNGYGLEVSGGSPKDRKKALENRLNNPIITVNMEQINDIKSFNNKILVELGYEGDVFKIVGSGQVEVKQELEEFSGSILVHKFDSVSIDLQRSVAQTIKGYVEGVNNVHFGFTSDEMESVVKANQDLSLRFLCTRIIE